MAISISRLSKRTQHSSVLVALLLLTMLVVPTPGGAAVSVDTDGFNPNIIGGHSGIQLVAHQPDGNVLISGDFTEVDGIARNGFARLYANGSLDSSFYTNISGSVYSLALQSDGKIIIGGNFTEVNGVARSHVARLNADGSLDSYFNPNIVLGSGPSETLRKIATIGLQPNGKIIIGGNFTEVNGVARSHVARLNADGSLDPSFNANESTGHFMASVVVIQPDGKVVVSMDDYPFSIIQFSYIFRLNSDGSLDSSFKEINTVPNPVYRTTYLVSTMVLQNDGKLLVGGSFHEDSGIPRNSIARFTALGILDTSFNPSMGEYSSIRSIMLQPDGKVLVGGQFTEINGVARNDIARINADGSLDTSFDPGTGTNEYVLTMAFQADGKVLIGGRFTEVNGLTRNYIARLNADGSLDAGFGQPSSGVSDQVQALAVQPDNKLLIGGHFTNIDGISRYKIARLNTDRSVDTSFDPGTGANNWVGVLALQPDGKVLVGGGFTEFDDVSRGHIARLHADGSLDTSFDTSTGASHSVRTLALQPDGKVLIGGDFIRVDGVDRMLIARLNDDGSIDASFNPGGWAVKTDAVSALLLQPDGKVLVGGRFTLANGSGHSGIVRLNSNGSLDTSFNPGSGANDAVFALAHQADGKILIGGAFTEVNGVTRNRIARLNTNGSLDTSFNSSQGADDSIMSIALQADGKVLIAGNFTHVNGWMRNYFARINADGSIDNSFYPGAGANGSVETLALQSDGSVVIVGHFTEVDGIEQNYISRLSQDEAALQQLSAAVDGESITWLHDGTAPMLEMVTFEVSNSLYGGWTMLGSGQRIAGGWTLDGLNLPTGENVYIRARGYYGTSAGSMTESILQFYLESPSIQVIKTATPESLPEPGGSFQFDVIVNNTSVINSVTVDSLIDDIHGNLNGQGDCAVPQTFAAGSSYNCSFSIDISGSAGVSETDTVTASGADQYGNPVSHSDTATVTITPAIQHGCFPYTPNDKMLMICW